MYFGKYHAWGRLAAGWWALAEEPEAARISQAIIPTLVRATCISCLIRPLLFIVFKPFSKLFSFETAWVHSVTGVHRGWHFHMDGGGWRQVLSHAVAFSHAPHQETRVGARVNLPRILHCLKFVSPFFYLVKDSTHDFHLVNART